MKLLIGCILTSLGSFIFGMGLGKVMISIRANINMYINERRLIMKLLNFKQNNQVKIGVQTDQGILDLQLAGDQLDKKVPTSMEELIQMNDLSLISEIVNEALQNTKDSTFFIRRCNFLCTRCDESRKNTVCGFKLFRSCERIWR